MKQKDNPEIDREAGVIPEYNKQGEVIAIYIVVVDVFIKNSILVIEHHVLYLWLLEDNKPLSTNLSGDLFVGDMIVLADEHEAIGIEFLLIAEISDFCERWKKSNAKIVWLEEGNGQVSFQIN